MNDQNRDTEQGRQKFETAGKPSYYPAFSDQIRAI
jgi:hypothetical protein